MTLRSVIVVCIEVAIFLAIGRAIENRINKRKRNETGRD